MSKRPVTMTGMPVPAIQPAMAWLTCRGPLKTRSATAPRNQSKAEHERPPGGVRPATVTVRTGTHRPGVGGGEGRRGRFPAVTGDG